MGWRWQSSNELWCITKLNLQLRYGLLKLRNGRKGKRDSGDECENEPNIVEDDEHAPVQCRPFAWRDGGLEP